jgi:aminoglycoside phosphotransferase (APT) family kinase protein
VANPSAPGPEEVSGALRRRLAGRFACEVADAEAPVRISGGFDFWVYGLHFAGPGLPDRWAAPVVARIAARPERFRLLERESRLQDWVREQGYPAPSVLELVPPGEVLSFPVQVMERLPGVTVAAAMAAAPWRMRRLAGRLGRCHAALHRVPVPEWAGDWSLAGNRLRLPRRLAADGSVPGLAEGLERAERIVPLLSVPGPSVCHGDFQPGNVLVDGERMSVIDWTDAGVGDRHGDVARTAWVFWLAAAAAAQRRERMALRAVAPVVSRAYLSAYRRELPVDAGRLRLWLPVHLLHAWAMAAADEQELSGPARFPAGLAAWARRQFWRHIDEVS